MSRPPTKAPAAAPPTEALVADRFRVDLAHPLPGAGGGLPAFAVTDLRDGEVGLMAFAIKIQVPAGDADRAARFIESHERGRQDPNVLREPPGMSNETHIR